MRDRWLRERQWFQKNKKLAEANPKSYWLRHPYVDSDLLPGIRAFFSALKVDLGPTTNASVSLLLSEYRAAALKHEEIWQKGSRIEHRPRKKWVSIIKNLRQAKHQLEEYVTPLMNVGQGPRYDDGWKDGKPSAPAGLRYGGEEHVVPVAQQLESLARYIEEFLRRRAASKDSLTGTNRGRAPDRTLNITLFRLLEIQKRWRSDGARERVLEIISASGIVGPADRDELHGRIKKFKTTHPHLIDTPLDEIVPPFYLAFRRGTKAGK